MKFEKRVKQIARAEKDVDRVLKAARLQRNPMDFRQLEMVLDTVQTIVIVVSTLGFFLTLVILMMANM